MKSRKAVLVAGIVVGVAVTASVLYFLTRPEVFIAELVMESDAMSVVNYYYPRRIKLQEQPVEPGLKLPDLASSRPLFGTLVLGTGPDSLITLLLDEVDGNTSYLYVDSNNNEDLTDDGEPAWDTNERAYKMKEVLIDVSYRKRDGILTVPYPVTFYRYGRKLLDSIICYRNGYRRGFVMLPDSAIKLAVFDDDLNGRFDEPDRSALVIDLDGDGVLEGESSSDELFALNAPFVVGGQAFRIKGITPAGDYLTIVRVDSVVTPKTSLTEELTPISFRTLDMDGRIIDLTDYRNRVVLIDFWATWCKPWEAELADLKRRYGRYNNQGFEIIGMNLDYQLDHLQEYLQENGITWPQIADGRGWDMSFVDFFNIKTLPRNFLLDKTGVIRYRDLRGKNLQSKIFELLNEPGTEE